MTWCDSRWFWETDETAADGKSPETVFDQKWSVSDDVAEMMALAQTQPGFLDDV